MAKVLHSLCPQCFSSLKDTQMHEVNNKLVCQNCYKQSLQKKARKAPKRPIQRQGNLSKRAVTGRQTNRNGVPESNDQTFAERQINRNGVPRVSKQTVAKQSSDSDILQWLKSPLCLIIFGVILTVAGLAILHDRESTSTTVSVIGALCALIGVGMTSLIMRDIGDRYGVLAVIGIAILLFACGFMLVATNDKGFIGLSGLALIINAGLGLRFTLRWWY